MNNRNYQCEKGFSEQTHYSGLADFIDYLLYLLDSEKITLTFYNNILE